MLQTPPITPCACFINTSDRALDIASISAIGYGPEAHPHRLPLFHHLSQEFATSATHGADEQQHHTDQIHTLEIRAIFYVGAGMERVYDCLRMILEPLKSIAILPLGTANNIAKTIGLLDMSLTDSIAGWTTACRMKYDVGIARGPWGSTFFLEGVGVGLFTENMARLDATGSGEIAASDKAEDQVISALDILHKQLPYAPATMQNRFGSSCLLKRWRGKTPG